MKKEAEAKALIESLKEIKENHFLSWEIVTKESKIPKSTLFRILERESEMSLITLRRLKAYIGRYTNEHTSHRCGNGCKSSSSR